MTVLQVPICLSLSVKRGSEIEMNGPITEEFLDEIPGPVSRLPHFSLSIKYHFAGQRFNYLIFWKFSVLKLTPISPGSDWPATPPNFKISCSPGKRFRIMLPDVAQNMNSLSFRQIGNDNLGIPVKLIISRPCGKSVMTSL
jgi:hypothetical protein